MAPINSGRADGITGARTPEAADTIRLTVAQATVRFLANQYVEHDGERHKFFAGCFGIFGHGNVAGIGQALLEQCVYDADTGQLLTGSYMDYTMPRADDSHQSRSGEASHRARSSALAKR